jgi:hypothetical protein
VTYRAKHNTSRRPSRSDSRSPKWWLSAKDNLGVAVFGAGALLAIVWQVLHFLGYIHAHR